MLLRAHTIENLLQRYIQPTKRSNKGQIKTIIEKAFLQMRTKL